MIVFAMCEPDDESIVRFVGITKKLEVGVKHVCRYGNGCGELLVWVDKLKKIGQSPVVKVLFEGEDEQARLFKFEVMQKFAEAGIQLFNKHRKADVEKATFEKAREERMRKKKVAKEAADALLKEEIMADLESRDPSRLFKRAQVSQTFEVPDSPPDITEFMKLVEENKGEQQTESVQSNESSTHDTKE